MLAERTPGQTAFFGEGREIGCFEGPDELAEKVRYFLEHEDEREAIREAGHRRCVESGYAYEGRMRDVLHQIQRLAEELGATSPKRAVATEAGAWRRPEA
jgi:spore maturation protein CgeB